MQNQAPRDGVEQVKGHFSHLGFWAESLGLVLGHFSTHRSRRGLMEKGRVFSQRNWDSAPHCCAFWASYLVSLSLSFLICKMECLPAGPGVPLT